MATHEPLPRSSDTRPLEAPGHERLCLVGWVDGQPLVRLLPESGRATIGRADDADVCILHATISRIHAAIHVSRADGKTVCQIEDLSSRNGTRARGAAVEPGQRTSVAVGDAMELGSVPFLLQIHRGREAIRATATAEQPVAARPREDVGARMRDVLALADRVAVGDINVLILGETGAGKEVVAERIHASSPRAKRPFVRLNCAALSEQLLESELFGHERGSFTGAIATKPGLLETADGGTVFLDEAGEMPTSVQVKLLRVIDERRVLRVGGLVAREIDVRFLSATNRDLTSEVARGRFRADLYFRLAGVSVAVPPLRERTDEILSLAAIFAARSAQRLGHLRPPRLDEAAVAQLLTHAWPGNVRELRNVIERAVLLGHDGDISSEHLRFDAMTTIDDDSDTDTDVVALRERASVPPTSRPPRSGTPLRAEVKDLERARIINALEECAGNQTRAARMLGMPRATFVKRLGAFGVPRPRKRAL